MVIDSDTHISPSPEGGIGITVETLIELMDKTGTDMSMSWPYYPYEREKLPDYCKYIYDSMKKFPQRIAGFGWIDPSLGIERAVSLTKTCMEEYGLYGVKLNGSQNNFRYDNFKITAPIVDIVAKAGGIVAMHVGADCPQRTHPYFAVRLAQAYPETTFLFIHMGGVTYPDISDCAVESAELAPNVLLVGSHVGADSILKAVDKLGACKICYGSDAPFNLMRVERARYTAMLDSHSKDDREKIMGGNIEKLLSSLSLKR